ncbi:hypothetical protein [Burkholderia pseudomallei]|uniref:hypothetical protein n=1 Tax=Burkholderia pseudomallei TaxID=28450 RepID=UPI0007560F7E|nr:hypothetical protein [Burkholderia pseudomallei]APD35660.1 hypothetical protein BK015_11235 [Burkholderia pseudomallei]ARK40874.1 hypothetical protein BOC60_12015 [Burkholderia pseudomallei]KWF23433.1 hypothetical protein WL84_03020 [Burkholderia cenocepacia]ONC13600.1 hypothetical protein AQ911_03660 [Burkholderia pseudomallei]
MRARKNPPPFTLENVLLDLKPGRVYSAEAISLKFGVSVDAVHQMMLGAVMLGEVKERPARRGFRAGYWVPDSGPRTLASRRSGPLATWQPLVGYTESLGRFRDLCMAIPRFRT